MLEPIILGMAFAFLFWRLYKAVEKAQNAKIKRYWDAKD